MSRHQIGPHLSVAVIPESEALVHLSERRALGVAVEPEHTPAGPPHLCNRPRHHRRRDGSTREPPTYGKPMDIRRMRTGIIRPELRVVELELERTDGLSVHGDKEKEAAADLSCDPLRIQFVDLPQLRPSRVGPV